MSNPDFNPFVYHTKNLSKNNHQPRVTVVGEPDGKYLNLAVARCSKNDQFSKRLGREIATNRLSKGEFIAQVPMEEVSLSNFISCAQAVSDCALKHGVRQKIAVKLVPQPMKAKCDLI